MVMWYGLKPSEQPTQRETPAPPILVAGAERREPAPVMGPAPVLPSLPSAGVDAGPPAPGDVGASAAVDAGLPAVAVLTPPWPPVSPPPPPSREEARPAPRSARLLVSSRPPNADVYLDGEKKGKTGRWYELTAGKSYEIQVRKKGYQTTEETIQATEGDARLSVVLKPARGPAQRLPRKKLARATPPEPSASEPVVEPREEPKEETRPEPPPPPPAEPGILNVNARPWGEVHIDGKKVADHTPLLGHSLRPGVHRVRVFFVSSQKFSEERKVQVKSGETQTVLFKE